MLSFKDWKSLNESYDVSMGLTTPASVGVVAPGYGGLSFEELLEAAKKKMKKKMMDDEGNDDEDEDADVEDEDDAETGDGEVVEPSAIKDKEKPEDDDDEESDDEDDEESDDEKEPEGKNPFLSNMKKKMNKMKKKMKEKMSSDKKSCDKMKKKMTAENSETIETIEPSNDPWLQSFKKMIANVDTRNDGITDYTNEDAIMPYIDINTGLTGERPDTLPIAEVPGQIGYAPQGKVGANFGN